MEPHSSCNLRHAIAMAAALGLAVFGTGWLGAYPLTDAQKQRLGRYVPKTLEKLERQIPVHVALIGDEVAGMETLDERAGNLFYSLHGFFLQGLEREFFYTGGIKWLNPREGQPAKLHNHRGNEITVETFTAEGSTALHALQALTTRVFLRHTDLVLVQAGLNDYRNGTPLDSVSRSVAHALAVCRAQGAELVLIGPVPLRQGDALRQWGGIRQITAELRRAADELGVLFLDPALDLMRTRPAAAEVSLEEKTIQLSNALRMDLLDYGPGKIENVRINARAHKRAGQGMFKQFLNGVAEGRLRVSGSAMRSGTDVVKLDLTVENPGTVQESGILAPLNAAERWEPAVPGQVIALKPGAKTSLSLEYRCRPQSPAGQAKAPAVPPLERLSSGPFCFPLLYSSLDETELLEQVVVPGPVAVRWDYTALHGVDKQFSLAFVLCNPAKKPVRGTYELTYGRQRAKNTFTVEGNSERVYTAQCVLPESGAQVRRRDPVLLKISSGDVSFEERRGLEITRHLGLGLRVPLARSDRFGEDGTDGRVDGGVTLEMRADRDSLWAEFDLGDRVLEQAGDRPALLLDLTLDGRPRAERHEFGFVSPLRIGFGSQPGAGTVAPIDPASFGNFYGKILSEAGVQAQLGIAPDGSRKTVTVRVPRIYLYRHEWQLGQGSCTLGLAARLRFLQVDRQQNASDYPAAQEWVTGSGAYGVWHAGALAGLELAPNPSPRWSVCLY